MNNYFRIRAFSLASAVVIACHLTSAHAEAKAIEIRPGDSLSRIVAEHYPNYNNNAPIMQFILEKNPQAFINNDVNLLVVGKVLLLPNATDIPAAVPRSASPPSPANSPATNNNLQKLQELEQALQALQAERNQTSSRLDQLQQENAELKNKLAAPTVDATTTENLQKAEQERDELRSRLQQLEAEKSGLENQQGTLASDKQQLSEKIQALETKVAALTADKEAIIAASRHAIPATGDGTELSRAEMDMEALNQQLDLIASANVQLQGEKDALQTERDELKARLSELAASKEAAETAETATPGTAASTADTTSGDGVPADTEAEPDQAAMDLEILTQQLDAIESANLQLQSEKEALQKELDTSRQQQLSAPNPAKEADSAQIKNQLEQLQQDLEKNRQELKLANAARANAELTRADLEKSSTGGNLWPWLLALLLAPLAWFLGRNTVQPLPQKPVPVTQSSPATMSPPTIGATTPAADQTEDERRDREPVVTGVAPEATASPAYPVSAANDDDPDVAIKLDMVRAYLDLRDSASAQPILNEVLREGGKQQRQEAREILSFLS